MTQSAILEVIIGMVFIYILLSLLVSQINTIVANTLNIRSEQLRKRVEAIIFDDDMQKRILAHPVVQIVQPPNTKKPPAEMQIEEFETTRVSTLPPKTFAQAMINVLSDPFLSLYAAISSVENDEERERLEMIANQIKANVNDPQRANAALTQLHETVVALEPPNRRDRRSLLRTLGPLQNSLRNIQSGNSGLLMVLDGVSQVNNAAFQRAMETVLSGVQNVKEAEYAIEEWFDNRLSQTKDMYGRTMQYFSLGFGLIIAVLLNVDSLYIAQTLWNDPALRQRVSTAAQTVDLSTAVADAQPILDEEGNPISADDTFSEQEIEQSVENAQDTLDQLLDLRLPIGWNYRPTGWTSAAENLGYDPQSDRRNLANFLPWYNGNWLSYLLTKIGGLGITAIAVAQGAPFWFDILRRLTGQQNSSSTNTSAEQA
jgi:hypothetical protein